MKIKQLEKLRDDLKSRWVKVRKQIIEAKRKDKEARRIRYSSERLNAFKRILNGEKVVSVAKSIGITPPCLNESLQRFCRRANWDLYQAGRRPDFTNNYITPPLQYLRDNKKGFGF